MDLTFQGKFFSCKSVLKWMRYVSKNTDTKFQVIWITVALAIWFGLDQFYQFIYTVLAHHNCINELVELVSYFIQWFFVPRSLDTNHHFIIFSSHRCANSAVFACFWTGPLGCVWAQGALYLWFPICSWEYVPSSLCRHVSSPCWEWLSMSSPSPSPSLSSWASSPSKNLLGEYLKLYYPCTGRYTHNYAPNCSYA